MILGIYLIGVVIATIAFLEEYSALDIVGSFIAGLLWPIIVPSRIIRRII